ncbi:efflux RND transporter periplasmic adaptor subunit [Nannocystis pusilla]|uniref:efflux RND transporter periplasmic adaptor subunit n=1 Tax=Nannocystis pusilla TaxID=889268 RepID=UPI003B80D0DB
MAGRQRHALHPPDRSPGRDTARLRRRGRSRRSRGPGGPGKGRRGGEAEALAVAVTTLSPATIERHYRGAGTLRALRAADLVALQPGVVLDLRAEEGDSVAEGQLLARLDGRAYQLQAARDKLSAQNAAKELQRLEQLSGLLSREELDKQRYAAESALASAQVSRHQASQTTVSAPFAGTITRRHIDVGNLATTSKSLYTIADLSALDLELHVPEREASAVQAGAPAIVELQDGTRFEARVERRAPVVDPLTGTVKFVVRARNFPAGAVPGRSRARPCAWPSASRPPACRAARSSRSRASRTCTWSRTGEPAGARSSSASSARSGRRSAAAWPRAPRSSSTPAPASPRACPCALSPRARARVKARPRAARPRRGPRRRGQGRGRRGLAGRLRGPGRAGLRRPGGAGRRGRRCIRGGRSFGPGPGGQVRRGRRQGPGPRGQGAETGPKGQAAAATPGVR